MSILLLRIGLTAALTFGFVDCMRTLRGGEPLTPFAWARLPGAARLAGPAGRRALAVLFAASAAAYLGELAAPLAAAALALSFCLAACLTLSTPGMGYWSVGADGRGERHVCHHLHLAGACVLGVAAAGVAAAATGVAHAGPLTVDAADALEASALWGCIGAHYTVSGLTKLRRQGLGWVDARLLPFYIALLRDCAEGDGGRPRTGPLADRIRRSPAVGRALLALALLLEVGAVAVCVPGLRWPVGVGFLMFHIASSRLLQVDFYENMLVLAGAVVAALAGAPHDPWACAAVAAALLLASFAASEALFPLSRLAMFTHGYRPQRIVAVLDAAGRRLPLPALLGTTTQVLSREVGEALDRGDGPDELAALLRARAARVGGPLPPGLRLRVRTLSADERGAVQVHDDEIAVPGDP